MVQKCNTGIFGRDDSWTKDGTPSEEQLNPDHENKDKGQGHARLALSYAHTRSLTTFHIE